MNVFKKVTTSLRTLFRREKLDAEMAEEMRLHIERRTQANIAAGMTPDEARYAAQRAFGGIEQIKEQAREDRSWIWLEQFQQDVRYGARALRKKPAFTAVVMLTLALGIGTNTAMFSVINAVLLRPLPFPEPERLVQIWESNAQRDLTHFSVAIANFADWRAHSQSWDALAAVAYRKVNLTGHGEPQQLLAQFVTADLLPLFGHRLAHGRGFLREEEKGDRGDVAILSDSLWRRSFGADPSIVDKTITVQGKLYTVVGIAAPNLHATLDSDVFLPLGPKVVSPDREDHTLDAVYGRLKAGVTLAQATAELSALARQLELEHPDTNAGWNVRLLPLFRAQVSEELQRALLVLLAAVGLLLLIACANFSGLLLVRAATRTREIAIRMAVGGGRSRIVRQLVTESVMLAMLGGALGALFAHWSVDALRSLGGLSLSRAGEISLDGRVLAFACGATLLTGIVSGLVPALQAGRVDVQQALKQASYSLLGSRRGIRNALLVGQLALSIVLLVGAGLLLRNLDQLRRTDLGYTPENVLTFQLAPAGHREDFFAQLLERLSALPGVRAVGLTNSPPMAQINTTTSVFPVGRALLSETNSIQCEWRMVSADYFRALGTPLLKGRVFTPRDNGRALKAVVINQALARALWGDDDPIGRQINPGGGTDYSTVIGVVGNIRSRNPAIAPRPAYFMSVYRGIPPFPLTLALRAAGDPRELLPAIRTEVQRLDAAVPLAEIKLLEELLGDRLAQPRQQAGLLAGFAALALVLAIIGTYGVMAYAVSQRTREVGIRLALGAQRRDVLRPLMREGLGWIIAGVSLGLAGAFGLTRLMQTMLMNVSVHDPLTFIATTALLVAAALLACWLPARRAARVDPMIALRSE
jgi:putative ABC transport system permease protein